MASPADRQKTRKKRAGGRRGPPANAWPKGVSGNPSGGPKLTDEARAARDLARAHAPEAIEKLLSLMRTAKEEKVQKAAADSVLDRGLGRPTQPVREDADNPFADLTDQELVKIARGFIKEIEDDAATEH